jgi:perosamine synthetase
MWLLVREDEMNIPITKMCLGNEEVEAVRKVLESGWLIMGSKCAEFENQVKAISGTKHAKSCSSCTTGLHMSLLACGVKKGDKVAVPAYTFVATANAVEYCGAEPIFVDIDLRTFNIDPIDLQYRTWYRKLSPVAFIPVHLFGLCADMAKVIEIANGRPVIEDAACALGSSCPEGMAGAMGNVGAYSFHPRKCVTTGEGGVVVTNDDEIAEKVHAYRDFGFSTTNIERHKSGATIMPPVKVLGYNYRLNDIQAAVGVEQMKKINWILEGKRRVAATYDRELTMNWLQTPHVPEGYVHNYQSYAVVVGGKEYKPDATYIDMWGTVRDRLMAYLKDKGIATRQGTHAVHMLDYYAKKYRIEPTSLINTYAADKMVITIPLYPQMTEDEQTYVIEAIRGFKV